MSCCKPRALLSSTSPSPSNRTRYVCSVNVVFSLAGGCCVAGKNDKETQYTLEFAARDQ